MKSFKRIASAALAALLLLNTVGPIDTFAAKKKPIKAVSMQKSFKIRVGQKKDNHRNPW